MAYFRHIEECVPEYGFVYQGWVPLPDRVTLTDTPERGATLATEAMALFERQDAEPLCASLNLNIDTADDDAGASGGDQ